MQGFSVTQQEGSYDLFMPTGRPANIKRTPLGQRIASLREAAGLSQQQLAAKIGVNQQMIAYWERRSVTLRPDQLSRLADTLKTSVDALFGKPAPKARGNGPVGKARQIFEAVSRLPRKQQEKVFDVLQPFIKEHLQTANSR
jgi:transcriptional regulator with XRE-family HTH domain